MHHARSHDELPRLGLIVPPAHGRVPDDGPRLYAGRAHFLARGLGIDTISAAGFAPVVTAIRDHALVLRDDGARAISLMGTSLSFHRGLAFTEDLCAQLSEATGLPCTTMSHAIVRALRALGVRRVAVATAYTEVLNGDLLRFLGEAGFEVTAIEGLGMTGVLAVGEVGPELLTPLAQRVVDQAAGAEGLLISCGGLRTLDLLAPLQTQLALPVVASSPAGFWDLITCAGLEAAAPGFGRLFELPASRSTRINPWHLA
ncbi:MAG: arylmalonate decarboxylase [Burkholderiales bacterium]|nr:arylmalonate decarboxylase [Burkholderiales bacterium]MBK8666392.1 arylmalonate decarboxylase [Burkholderiales bacterium]